ncbi:response regulator [Pseudomonas arsenicoxydans]|uniref:histidine kinase n=1 Tax=Pseudomonas arsenicoxydans TaxID=702115 RepID=A0A4P6G9H4_9PSED|nr:response regulator [Pseudomonas arsenicoxydans]QAY86150.1 response regulator [Pseudomonas arsenicoxydans]
MPVRLPLDAGTAKPKVITPSPSADASTLNSEKQSDSLIATESLDQLRSLNNELTDMNDQLRYSLEQQRAASLVYLNVLYSINIAAILLDEDLNIRLFTPASQSLFNILAQDIGRPLADLRPLASDSNLLEDARTVMRDKTPLEREVESRSGVSFTRRISPYSQQDSFGDGVVITFTDICDKKQITQALEKATQKAELATATRSRFLACASHDLRQPLQTLKLLQGLLLDILNDEQPRKLTVRIGETVGAMSGMLNALLDINHIETGTVQATPVSFRVSDLLDRLADEFSYKAGAKGLKLKVVPCHLSVESDPRLLEQILRNLLSNALKYTYEGRILLGCRRHGGWLSIEVWDTGIGMESSVLESLIEEQDPTDNPGQESGAALLIVKRLCAVLGHRLRAQSSFAKGSTFSIDVALSRECTTLPIVVQDGKPQEPGAVTKNGMILIVEDDAELLELLGNLLKSEGYQVAMAIDGATALDSVTHGGVQPDLILADFNLPGSINGLQMITQLRKKLHRSIPAIVLTGDISRQTSRDVAFEHCTQLNKPAKLKEIIFVITSLLAHQCSATVNDELLEDSDSCDPGPSTIFVVDADDLFRDTIRGVLESSDYHVQDYASCEAFLTDYSPGLRACLLVDAHSPGMDGLELLYRLRSNGDDLPAVMISGSSDVSIAVDAMKAGASDFIEKPFGRIEVLQSIARALEHSLDASKKLAWTQEAAHYIDSLTLRQRQIMDMVLAGHPSKNIAAELGISQRTVENHRASIMARTHSKSIPALARIALAANAHASAYAPSGASALRKN